MLSDYTQTEKRVIIFLKSKPFQHKFYDVESMLFGMNDDEKGLFMSKAIRSGLLEEPPTSANNRFIVRLSQK
ncbi:MAG TPA: hypothetical protein VKT28_12285 [Puia sp.]|nr:hypothetical protein [Puia sp.]